MAYTFLKGRKKKEKEKVKEWRVVFIPQPFYIFTMKSAIAALHNVRTQTAVSHSCCSCLGQLLSQLSMDSLTCCSHKWHYWFFFLFQWSGCKWGQEHFGFLTSNTKYMRSPLLYQTCTHIRLGLVNVIDGWHNIWITEMKTVSVAMACQPKLWLQWDQDEAGTQDSMQ